MKVGLSFKICFIASGVLLSLAAAQAREASFLAPVPASTSLGAASVQVTPNETFTGKEAVHVPTPQPSPPFQAHIDIQAVKDLDLGDVGLKIAKKATASFVNRGNVSVVLDTVNIATSSNVDYTILHNACAKSTLEIGRSCDIDFEITPKSIGSWALDLALMPYASQALAHLHVAGRSEAIKTVEKLPLKGDDDLILSQKKITPIDFGDVDVGDRKIVRSALMVNDSEDIITLNSIEVVAVDSSLSRLNEGCMVNMQLQPQQSCPVVLGWQPTVEGSLSTDLIIRYNGRPGFVVIPVKGGAKKRASLALSTHVVVPASSKNTPVHLEIKPKVLTRSPAKLVKKDKDIVDKRNMSDHDEAQDVQGIIGVLPDVSSKHVLGSLPSTNGMSTLRLIGTVGERAILLKPDGTTMIVHGGDNVMGGLHPTKVLSVHPQSVDIGFGNTVQILRLEVPPGRDINASSLPRDGSDRMDSKTTEFALPGSLLLPLPANSTR